MRPNRETVTTINRDGSRFFLHPADTRGFWTNLRRLTALILIGIYALLPWIPINGYPAVFLDVLHRRFHLFGFTLAFQDTYLLFFGITGLAFLLFYVTAFVGRVWCGFACPQTVFLEHVYRRIERWIDGDAPARKKLAAAPWDSRKIAKRLLKHSLFLLVSLLIVHLLISYFVSLPQLWEWMRQSPGQHWAAFVFMVAATGIIYVNFSWFREQLCLIICPYGRIQSALIDEHTINVAYDERRGEPRGKIHKGDTAPQRQGDCIDCHRCVQVCPTGIDIRQGLQLECLACTACIDACDEIMDKVGRPRGLIRYASQTSLAGEKTRWLRPRTLLYTLFLLSGMTAAGLFLSRMEPITATLIRMAGQPYYVTPEAVRNQYQVRLVNKSNQPVRYGVSLAAVNTEGLKLSGFDSSQPVPPMQEETRILVLQQERAAYQGPFAVRFVIENLENGDRVTREIEFLGPDGKLLRSATQTAWP